MNDRDVPKERKESGTEQHESEANPKTGHPDAPKEDCIPARGGHARGRRVSGGDVSAEQNRRARDFVSAPAQN